ncbi:hypothetical protein ACFLYV_04670 [Chloroflexota bacterium]
MKNGLSNVPVSLNYHRHRGRGNTRVSLSAGNLGSDHFVFVYNENTHIGAVAIAEYDATHKRASTSVISALGHKDDSVAYQAAHDVCKASRRTASATAGIHKNNANENEIMRLVKNANALIDNYCQHLLEGESKVIGDS